MRLDKLGQITDLGDILKIDALLIKGRRLNAVWRFGAPMPTTPADRVVRGPAIPSTGKVDVAMDLMADQKVTAAVGWTDEVGNPVPAPADATATFSVSDPSIISLTDNGDGTCVLAATGTLGACTVHFEATGNGRAITGDDLVTVVPGLAERATLTFGTPEEVTPDA